MAIKYNYPHTFFLSVGIALFLFGLPLFYINDYTFSNITLGKIITHISALVLGIVSVIIGIIWWIKKEKEKKDLADLSRTRILLELEKMQLELEDFKNKKKKEQLEQEIKDMESSKDKKKGEIEKRNEQLKDLIREIKKKQEEKEKTTASIYEIQKKEVEKIPDNYLPKTFWGQAISGSNLWGLSGNNANEYTTFTVTGLSSSIVPKTCLNCKSISYVTSSTDKCPVCHAVYS